MNSVEYSQSINVGLEIPALYFSQVATDIHTQKHTHIHKTKTSQQVITTTCINDLVSSDPEK